jgi:predicted RNase H-like nuclease
MTWVAGADGFKRGWRVVLCEIETDTWSTCDVPAFGDLLKLREAPSIVCVDMPIGLHEHTSPGGRECETLARGLLGPRRSSVFSALGRQTLGCLNRADAHATSVAAGGVGIGAQAWGLAAKLREVDGAMSTERQTVVFEVHPELCFWAMNGRQPMRYAKKTGAGENDRIARLVQSGMSKTFLEKVLGELRSGRDDFIDACAAAWTARRVFDGAAERLPSNTVRDSRGLDMAMWL